MLIVVIHHLIMPFVLEQTRLHLSGFLPVSQSQDKQLQEGRVYEQVLIVPLKLREARQPVSPAPCGLHRDGEQSVKELDMLSI